MLPCDPHHTLLQVCVTAKSRPKKKHGGWWVIFDLSRFSHSLLFSILSLFLQRNKSLWMCRGSSSHHAWLWARRAEWPWALRAGGWTECRPHGSLMTPQSLTRHSLVLVKWFCWLLSPQIKSKNTTETEFTKLEGWSKIHFVHINIEVYIDIQRKTQRL